VYMEVTYDELREWEYTRDVEHGWEKMTHCSTGDFVQIWWGDELPRIRIAIMDAYTYPFGSGDDPQPYAWYHKNTDTYYAARPHAPRSTIAVIDTPADAWDLSAATFALTSRLAKTATAYPGGLIVPSEPGNVLDIDDDVFADFPSEISIVPI